MTLNDRIEALDESLFGFVEAQTTDWDRRSLLAVHAAAAARLGSFAYLEIGSYLGGSLQVLVRDPRCTRIVSIDPRPPLSPDLRGRDWTYDDNSTANMLAGLARIPESDVSKIVSLELGTDSLTVADLPARPDVCLVDGEHTDDAALRDANFCAAAMNNEGVVMFHDYDIVGGAVRTFLREHWAHIALAIPFTGAVFAVELGGRGILDSHVIDRAVSSPWHSFIWRQASRFGRTALPFLAAWRLVPTVDAAVAAVRGQMQSERSSS